MQTFETQWGGKPLKVEVGRFAQAADGSCVVTYGNTVVMATATMSSNVREGMNWFPLMVDYEEKFYAAGRIKGSRFMKKEGRPSDNAVLVGRYIDRAIRPLFDQRMRNDIQVITTVLQFDGENDSDIPALIAASCALHISDIPWNGPIASIRVGQINGEWVINPSYDAREKSTVDLAFAGTTEKVVMVEAGANESPDTTIVEAFRFGLKHLKEPIALIEEVRAAVGKEKLDPFANPTPEQQAAREAQERVEAIARPFILEGIQKHFYDAPQATKVERAQAKRALKDDVKAFLVEQGIEDDEIRYGTGIIEEMLEAEVSRRIVEDKQRVDGRGIEQVRDLVVEVGLFERLHGSAHFKRGETQVLSMLTLGSPGDEQTLDNMEEVGTKRYMHHYNFLPYSVGEVKPMRGPGRREIGHGALAEKAILPVLPNKEDFPYTIRVVSEVLMSNGSSSMASTCGSSLVLMDAGVPIKAPVAGVAMGLAMTDDGSWQVITDLQDLEDGKGGMDFKITGTRDGITSIQMDTKTDGLTMDIIEKTFEMAHTGRLHILDQMDAVISESRPELSPFAPRITTMNIDPELIGTVIGPSGKMINEIISTTGVGSIDIEDSGFIMITSTDAEAAEKARQWIEDLTRTVEAGETFTGKITRLMDFGAFAEVLPGKEGLIHISELAPWRVEKVADVVKIGDEVQVKVKEIDNLGRINLSMKQAEGNDYSHVKKPAPSADRSARTDKLRGDRPKKGPFKRSS